MTTTSLAIPVIDSAPTKLRGATSSIGTAAIAPPVLMSADGDTLVVAVAGDVDLAVRPVLDLAVLRVAAAAGAVRHVAVDLSRVTFLGSTGVSFLLCLLAETVAARADLSVRGQSPAAARVLRLAGFESLLPATEVMDVRHRPLVAA